MTFTPKVWQNSPNTSTPISAAALVDIETRLSDYTDVKGTGEFIQVFSQPGTLVAGTSGTAKFRVPTNMAVLNIVATVGTVPTGASVVVDVNRNGTTIFTTQASRPTIAISNSVSNIAVPQITAMNSGDLITVDIDQIGSTIPGADLTLTLYMQKSAISVFAPTDLSGLLGWYRADTLGLTNGVGVSSWPDSSTAGHSLSQATGGNQPTFQTSQVNGLPCLRFDGSNDNLASAAFASPTAGCSVLVVLNASVQNSYRVLFNHSAAATWATPFARVACYITDAAASNFWQFFVEDTSVGANGLTDVIAASTGSWQLMSFYYDASNQFMYRNGTQLVTQARAGTLTSSTRPLFIGTDTGQTQGWFGDIAEVIYYDRALTSGERSSAEGYLRTKYGV